MGADDQMIKIVEGTFKDDYELESELEDAISEFVNVYLSENTDIQVIKDSGSTWKYYISASVRVNDKYIETNWVSISPSDFNEDFWNDLNTVLESHGLLEYVSVDRDDGDISITSFPGDDEL